MGKCTDENNEVLFHRSQIYVAMCDAVLRFEFCGCNIFGVTSAKRNSDQRDRTNRSFMFDGVLQHVLRACLLCGSPMSNGAYS
jgi:hypothetical protein